MLRPRPHDEVAGEGDSLLDEEVRGRGGRSGEDRVRRRWRE